MYQLINLWMEIYTYIVAVHSLTGHRVAIKLVSRRRVKDQDLAERVRREIRHLQRLQHPHIIKL
jgi:serine/threonine protein kinase